MMNREFKEAAAALAVFELWLEGYIDHNIAVPCLFNIRQLEKYQSSEFSQTFLDAFENAVEYETIRSIMDKDSVQRAANQILNGFKTVIKEALNGKE